VQGRVIDLSHAAQVISMPGIANVRLEVVSIPPTRAADLFAVQGRAFSQRSEAERLREQMEQKYGVARLVFRRGDQTWRALVGLEPSLERANLLAQELHQEAGPAFVILVDSDEP
jgi:rare lipoprotein A (peptidoglycan hydrolase)